MSEKDSKLGSVPAPAEREAKQFRIDLSNLLFDAQMADEHEWQTDVIHKSVIIQTLREIAGRYEAAWQAARSAGDAPREWIPVSERLPKVNTYVFASGGKVVWVAMRNSAGRWNLPIFNGESLKFWQPLPAPPVVDSGAIPAEEEKHADLSE